MSQQPQHQHYPSPSSSTAPSSPQTTEPVMMVTGTALNPPLSHGSVPMYQNKANFSHVRSRSDSNPLAVNAAVPSPWMNVNPFDQFPTSSNVSNNNAGVSNAANVIPPKLPTLSSSNGPSASFDSSSLSPRNTYQEHLHTQQHQRQQQQQTFSNIPNPSSGVIRASSDPPISVSGNNPFQPSNMSNNSAFQVRTPISESKEELALENQIEQMEAKRKEAEQSESASNSSSFLNIPSLSKMFTPLRSGSEANNMGNGRLIILTDDQRDDANFYDKSVIISGYLYKQTRNGSWQRRFFETNGQTLTYFKSRKRTKKLAELDLYKVGSIGIDPNEPDGSTFIIQVKNRPYYLKAENRDYAQDWVIQLNLVREARFGIGGMKLSNGPEAGTELTTNRQRSHGLRAEDKNIMFQEVDIPDSSDARANVQLFYGQSPYSQPQDSEGGGQELFTDWKKKGGRLRVLRYKLVRWAKKIHLNSICFTHKDDVVVPQNSQRSGDSSDGGDTSVGGSEATTGSHNQASSGPTASASSSIISALKGANLSPKRREVEYVGTDERGAPTPTFHMA